MTYIDHITSDKRILGGKPIIQGTRLSVECIIGQLSRGASYEELLSNYPGLTMEDILGCLEYAAKSIKDEVVLITPASSEVE